MRRAGAFFCFFPGGGDDDEEEEEEEEGGGAEEERREAALAAGGRPTLLRWDRSRCPRQPALSGLSGRCSARSFTTAEQSLGSMVVARTRTVDSCSTTAGEEDAEREAGERDIKVVMNRRCWGITSSRSDMREARGES